MQSCPLRSTAFDITSIILTSSFLRSALKQTYSNK